MTGFTNEIVEEAWARSGGICECERGGHGHTGRCEKELIKDHRGDKFSYFGWEVRSKSGHYKDSISDCEILCWDPCYVATLKKQ